MDELIRSSRLKNKITLYRGFSGLGGEVDLSRLLGPGNTLQDPAFLSTSTSPDVAREFASEGGLASYVGAIEAPAGTPAFRFPDDPQQEVVLPRDTTLKLTKVDHDSKVLHFRIAKIAGDEFVESEHPREEHGKFASKGSGKFTAPQFGLTAAPSSSAYKPPAAPRPPLDPAALKRVGAQKGSNPGGTFENAAGERFYVKKGHSTDHVREELTAAALARLAGARTLKYRPVQGGAHVATEIEKLDKDNANKLDAKEIAELRKDFATHAWLANWDVAGLGGDNVGTVKGNPTALDLGGALSYRAQGAAKGKAFGDHVGEITSLRDKNMNRDAAKLFGEMTPAELRESARYVTDVTDKEIKSAVTALGGSDALAAKMIARRDDIAEQAKRFGAAPDVNIYNKGEKAHGFQAWEPPGDWANVEGQAEIDEPPLPEGKHVSTGVIMKEPDGRYWIMRPSGGFGGYEHSFPKGGMEPGLSPQANAIKETFEETGLKASILAHLGDFEGDTGVSRYYLGQRTGGDPTKHGWESDGVVLAPKAKLAGFLNRPRDQKIAAALDAALAADAWQESEHPRVQSGATAGQFAKKGEGGGAGASPEDLEDDLADIESSIDDGDLLSAAEAAKESPTAWQILQKDSPEKAAKIAHLMKEQLPEAGAPAAAVQEQLEAAAQAEFSSLLTKPPIAGSNYRKALVKAIQKAKELKLDHVVDALKKNLVESWQKTHANFVKKGDLAKASKIAKTLAKLGVTTVTKVPPPVAPQHELSAKMQAAAKAASETKKHADFAAIQAQKEQAPPPAFPPPTPQELEKAKKTVALQLKFVPGASELSASAQKEAQKAVDAFNKLYADKQMTETPQLVGKINAFKTLTHKVAALAKVDGAQKAAEASAKAEEAKIAAAQAKAEQQSAIQEAKEKNQKYMRELGISEAEAHGFAGLVAMMGIGEEKTLVVEFKSAKKEAATLGHNLTGFEGALIRSYKQGSSHLNTELRKPLNSWSADKWAYSKALNKALDKLPKYTGAIIRNAGLSADIQGRYKVGNIVMENGFTGASDVKPNGVFTSYNTRFFINAIGKNFASIKEMYGYQGEGEILAKARTAFHVDKVEGVMGEKGSASYKVYLTEIET